MTAIKTIVLWVLALSVAAWALWRVSRGRRALADGRWSPRFVHMVAVLFVALGGCPRSAPDSVPATPPPRADVDPGRVPEPTVALAKEPPAALARGLRGHFELAAERGDLSDMTRAMIDGQWTDAIAYAEGVASVAGGQALRDALVELCRQRARRVAPTFEQIASAVAAAGELPVYYAPLAAALWRELHALSTDSLDAAAVAGVLHQLEDQHRMAAALQRAQADTGPVTFRPWLKKSAPPRDYDPLTLPAGLDEAVRRAYAATDAGSWASESTLPLHLVSTDATVILHRSGKAIRLAAGTELKLRRLDVIEVAAQSRAPARFDNPLAGALSVAPGAMLTAWTVDRQLSAAARTAIDDLVERAMTGNDDAIARLESHLPAAATAIRRAVAATPAAAGAAKLRLVLALFDE